LGGSATHENSKVLEGVRQFRDPPTAESDAPVATVTEGDSGNQNREYRLRLVS
jgi:hypothetical protein